MINDKICPKCNSGLSVFKENNKIVVECSYCGHKPENIPASIIKEVLDYE